MRFFVKVLKGILIGISVVIPGVSGGSMAVAMGIYDQLIEFTTVSRAARARVRVLLPYLIGIFVGVAGFAYLIERLFEAYPLQTAFAFVGMILGALPMLVKKVRGERFRLSHAAILIGTIALMVMLPVASRQAGVTFALNQTWGHAALAMGLGFVAAATMVIPGVSGSMLLILLGYYEPMLQYVNAFTRALLRFDIASMFSGAAILMPFTVGVALGAVIMARGIKTMLRRFPCATYYGIIGLVASSPFAVLYQQSFAGVTFFVGAACAVLLAAGFLFSIFLGKGEQHADL